MNDQQIINLILTFVIGLLGVAVGYGALKNQVRRNASDIMGLHKWKHAIEGNPGDNSAYMKRIECMDRHDVIAQKLNDIQIDYKKLQNFARYTLMREGLSLSEVDKIINGE